MVSTALFIALAVAAAAAPQAVSDSSPFNPPLPPSPGSVSAPPPGQATPSTPPDVFSTITVTRVVSGYRFGGDKTDPLRTETATETYSAGVLLRPSYAPGEGRGVNVGAIVGVVCGLAALIAVLTLWYFLSRRRERRWANEYESESDVELPAYTREESKQGLETVATLESPPPAYSPGKRRAPSHVRRGQHTR